MAIAVALFVVRAQGQEMEQPEETQSVVALSAWVQ